MNDNNFCYILLGKKRIADYMIICRIEYYNKWYINKIARYAFPELFGFFRFFWWFKKIKTRLVFDYRDYPSHFDCQVGPIQQENNWDEFPYVALRAFVKEDQTCCESISYTL